MILTQRTQLDTDLAERDDSVLRGAEALHHAAAVLRAGNEWFATLPTERLLAVLNTDLQTSIALATETATISAAVNQVLNAVNHPQFTGRAPTVIGRPDVVFDGTAFVHIPAPEPEPEPAPEQ